MLIIKKGDEIVLFPTNRLAVEFSNSLVDFDHPDFMYASARNRFGFFAPRALDECNLNDFLDEDGVLKTSPRRIAVELGFLMTKDGIFALRHTGGIDKPDYFATLLSEYSDVGDFISGPPVWTKAVQMHCDIKLTLIENMFELTKRYHSSQRSLNDIPFFHTTTEKLLAAFESSEWKTANCWTRYVDSGYKKTHILPLGMVPVFTFKNATALYRESVVPLGEYLDKSEDEHIANALKEHFADWRVVDSIYAPAKPIKLIPESDVVKKKPTKKRKVK
jgi:hypothetical protein